MPDPIPIALAPRLVAGTSGGRCGPFVINDALYGVFVDPALNRLQVWKSADFGSTWARIDSGGEPSTSTSQFQYSAVLGTETNPKIHCVFANASDKFSIVTFDSFTDSWDSPFPSTDDVPIFVEFLDLVFRETDGARLVLSSSIDGSFQAVWARLSGGNSWTAAAALIGTSGDGTDTRTALWARAFQGPGINAGKVYVIADRQVVLTSVDALVYRAIDAANTVGTLTTIDAAFLGGLGGRAQEATGAPDFEFIVPYVQTFTIGGDVIFVRRSTDGTTWSTEEAVPGRPPNSVQTLGLGCFLDSEARPNLFWTEYGFPGIAIYQSIYTAMAGWGDPVLLYSDDTNNSIGRISVAVLGDGVLGFFANFGEQDSFDETQLPVYFFYLSSGSPALSLYTIYNSNEA